MRSADQVWATDISYIPMAKGFVYLVAIVDWFSRIRAVLEAAGSDIAHLLRLRTYIADHDVEKLQIVGGELAAFYGDVLPAPNTVIGVQVLALPGFLIEIEATALLI